MAKKIMIVSFSIKKPGISEEAGVQFKNLIKQKLKASVKKEKLKGKGAEWTLKAKEPELVTVRAIAKAAKKCNLNKVIKNLAIAE